MVEPFAGNNTKLCVADIYVAKFMTVARHALNKRDDNCALNPLAPLIHYSGLDPLVT